jgi:hypothetical protein
MTLPFIGEFMAIIIYLVCGLSALAVWNTNPFLSIMPLDIAIYWYLFAPNLQDSCFGYYVGSCRFDRWMGENEWFRMEMN